MANIDLPDFDLLRALRVFVTVVESGGFSAASQRLALARGQPSRYLAKLEARLGARLLQRTTRRQSLTEAGTALYQRAAQILLLVDELERDLVPAGGQVSGRLRLSAPLSFGIRYLAPILARFKQRHPALILDVTLTDELVNLVEGGFDLAIRIAAVLDPGLVARPLARTGLVLCASPAYLASRGRPGHPRELAGHECLLYSNAPAIHEWRLQRGAETALVRVQGSIQADNGEVLLAAAEAGLGVLMIPRFLARDALAQGRLETILGDWQPPGLTIYAVYADRRWVPPRARALIDFLVEQLDGEVP